MKKIFLSVIALLLITTSCRDEELDRLQINKITKGAILRTLSKDIKPVDVNDLGKSNSTVTIEFDDFENQQTLKSVDYYVSYTDTKPDSDGKLLKKEEIKLGTVEAGSFNTSEGKPQTTITFNAQEAFTKLGLTANDVDKGNVILYRLSLNTTDGRVFTSSNVRSSVANSSAFKTPFRYSTKIEK